MTINSIAVEQPQPVRNKLFDAAVASVRIQKSAKLGMLPNDHAVKYFQFPFYVKGGCINVFFHSNDHSQVGKYVRARIEVYEKIFADGRRYIHVDLYPVGPEVAETNRLFFIPHSNVEHQPHWHVFETSDIQGQGLIVLGALDELYPKAIEPKPVPEPVVSSTASAPKPVQTARIKAPKLPRGRSAKPTAVLSSFVELGERLGAK